MNGFQIGYAIALAGVFAWRGPSIAAWGLLANMLATLVACLAFDQGYLARPDATLAMMIIDLASGVGMLRWPGLPRIVAAGYCITVPIYALAIVFGVQTVTTFAIVNAVAFIQVAVVAIGTGGNVRGGGGRLHPVGDPLPIPGGTEGVGGGCLGAPVQVFSANSGGLNE